MIAFHVDQDGKKREKPKAWSPENGICGIHHDPSVQEAFVELRPRKKGAETTQIKLRQDEIVVLDGSAEQGRRVQISDESITITSELKRVMVGADGSVLIESEESDTLIEGNGRVEKLSKNYQAQISPDGSDLTRRSQSKLAMIRGDGALVKDIKTEQIDDL